MHKHLGNVRNKPPKAEWPRGGEEKKESAAQGGTSRRRHVFHHKNYSRSSTTTTLHTPQTTLPRAAAAAAAQGEQPPATALALGVCLLHLIASPFLLLSRLTASSVTPSRCPCSPSLSALFASAIKRQGVRLIFFSVSSRRAYAEEKTSN